MLDESLSRRAKLDVPDKAVRREEPLPMTVLIRTLNEGDRIERLLSSLESLASEILVIDSGSTDATVDIARRYGATVLFNPWQGFGPQRRFGEENCSYDTIFSLDADEQLTPDLVAEIRNVFSKPDPPRLAIVRKAMIIPGRDRPTAFPFCHEQIYIYDRRIARTTMDPNLDKLDLEKNVRPFRLRALCLHFGFRDWSHATRKFLSNAELAATTLRRSPKWLALRLTYEFPLNFLKFYFLRRYFLAGTDGLILAAITAYGRFIRLAMIYEAATKQSRPNQHKEVKGVSNDEGRR